MHIRTQMQLYSLFLDYFCVYKLSLNLSLLWSLFTKTGPTDLAYRAPQSSLEKIDVHRWNNLTNNVKALI